MCALFSCLLGRSRGPLWDLVRIPVRFRKAIRRLLWDLERIPSCASRQAIRRLLVSPAAPSAFLWGGLWGRQRILLTPFCLVQNAQECLPVKRFPECPPITKERRIRCPHPPDGKFQGDWGNLRGPANRLDLYPLPDEYLAIIGHWGGVRHEIST